MARGPRGGILRGEQEYLIPVRWHKHLVTINDIVLERLSFQERVNPERGMY